MSGSEPETTLFNYLLSIVPQLITIIAAIATGFKAMGMRNEKKIKEAMDSVMNEMANDKEILDRDMKAIYSKFDNLDHQYKIITDFINKSLERHERMLERLNSKNGGSTRYGDRFGGGIGSDQNNGE